MTSEEQFLSELSRHIIVAGGKNRFTPERAQEVAVEVLRRLREIGIEAYPSLLDTDDLRFIYQWEMDPPVLTIMLWVENMWQDMARIVVPLELVGE